MAENFDAFISHSHRDDPEWIRQFAGALKEHKLSVWLDEEQIKAGERLDEKIRDGLMQSAAVVFLVERGAAGSNFLAPELGMALGQGKKVIPVVAADVPAGEIPGPIRMRRYLRKENPSQTADEIARAITA